MRRSADRALPASLLACCFGLGLGAAPAVAQDMPSSRQLELAAGLAREFGFVDLAQRVVEDLRKKDPGNQEQLAYVIASLLRDAIPSSAPGVTSPDAATRGAAYRDRLSAYDKAIDSFDTYLGDKNRKYQRSEAARDMLKLVKEKLDITLFWLEGDADQSTEVKQHLTDGAIERQTSGTKRWQTAVRNAEAEAGQLEEKSSALFDTLTGDEEKDKPIQEQIDELETALARIQFEKGEIYLSQYKLLTLQDPNAKDAKDFLDVAKRTFRDVADTSGDSSNAGMYATSRQAECLLYEGKAKEALRYFTRVYEAALPRPKKEEGKDYDPLSIEPLVENWKYARDEQHMNAAEYQGYARGRRLPMCQAYETAIRLFRAKGFLPEALDIANQFLEERQRWKAATESSEPALRELGNFDAAYRATLEAGIALALAGQTGAALELIWNVAQANLDPLTIRPMGHLGRKAIDALRQIAANVEEGQLNAEQFRAAAMAAMSEKDYRGAIPLFRKALKRFSESGLSGELVPAETFLVICYNQLAHCFNNLTEAGDPRRQLAAASARAGALHFFEADERYAGAESPRCQITKSFRALVSKLETEDPAAAKLWERWKDEATVLGSVRCEEGAEELMISDATKSMNADRYEKAISDLKPFTNTEHRAYFQAQTLIGRCFYELATQLKDNPEQKAKAVAEFQKAAQQLEKALADLQKRKDDEKAKGRSFGALREATYVEVAHYYAGRAYREMLALAKDEAKVEEKDALRKKATDHFRESSADPWQNVQTGSLSLTFGIPMLIESKRIDEAKTWFGRLEEKVGATDPTKLVNPAFALYSALKPEAQPDPDASLDPRYDAATYEAFKQSAQYLSRANAGTKPNFNNRWIEAKTLTEIAKTGAPGVAEAALAKWIALSAEPEAALPKYEGFAIPIARTRLLIGGIDNYRQAAEIFARKCFYAWKHDAKGAQDWSGATGWSANKRKMTIKFRDKVEYEYLFDDVKGDNLTLCALAHAGGLAPNWKEPGKDPIPTVGLGELSLKANPSGKEEISAAIRAHQVGKEVWGYLLSLEKKGVTEEYLHLHLHYLYTKALLCKNLDPNKGDHTSLRSQLDTFKTEICQAGEDWENFPGIIKRENGDELPEARKKAWRAAYRWLDRFVGT